MRIAIVVVHLIAFVVPFLSLSNGQTPTDKTFRGWPEYIQGMPIEQLALSERELGFTRGFPGKVARFTDGSREIIYRWLSRPTRQLHPAADCLRAVGYQIEPRPIEFDLSSNQWGCVHALKNGQVLKVCERIYDEHGNSWSDPSAWFWSVSLGKTTAPWWSITTSHPQ